MFQPLLMFTAGHIPAKPQQFPTSSLRFCADRQTDKCHQNNICSKHSWRTGNKWLPHCSDGHNDCGPGECEFVVIAILYIIHVKHSPAPSPYRDMPTSPSNTMFLVPSKVSTPNRNPICSAVFVRYRHVTVR